MCGERALELTRTEFALLELLARNPRVVLPRRVIFERVWGYDVFPSPRTVDNFIVKLRKKIEKDPSHPRYVLTEPWLGYRFQFPTSTSERSPRRKS